MHQDLSLKKIFIFIFTLLFLVSFYIDGISLYIIFVSENQMIQKL